MKSKSSPLPVILLCALLFLTGCTQTGSASSSSVTASVSDSDASLILVQTTDNGDQVLKDTDGNQFVVYKENSGDDTWDISADNYKSKTVTGLPSQYEYEVTGGTSGGVYQVNAVLEISYQYTGTSTNNNVAVHYSYSPDSDEISIDEYSVIPDDISENIKTVLTDDNLKALIKEIIAVKEEYDAMKTK